ncbi:pterin 4 alpha carbinolamine dehydratase [Phlyctema vagabunda]|uniref:4a-hydroxytetrahydrobiopterin dehydratase n=1 Tax=Phlyctema vagabunda TaxID=108571 RepID=A0ABR4PE58_9HELO
MSSHAPIIEGSSSSIQELLIPFRSPDTSPKEMLNTVHKLTRHVVEAGQAHDQTLRHVTAIPILRAGMPMFVGAQGLFESCGCILARCHKKKGTQEVIVDWLGRAPFPAAVDDGRLVILDTIIATGDTIVKLCDDLWERMGSDGHDNETGAGCEGKYQPRSVIVMTCYAAPEALEKIARHPIVQYVVVAAKADSCDAAGYLVPYTHGDMGDKLYGLQPRVDNVVVAKNQDEDAVKAAVEDLLTKKGGMWTLTQDGTAIEREILFPTFKAAQRFINQIAEEAARHRHHPEWSNVYNKVTLRWTTHEPRGLTQQDIDLARLCDKHSQGEVEK